MDTMKLFMAIPDCINFLRLGRYGCFSEQTFPNLFDQTSESWIFTSMHRLQPSTWPKRHTEARNNLFHILLQVFHTQCLYA